MRAPEVGKLEPEQPRPDQRAKRKRASAKPPPSDWKALVMRSRDSPSLAPRRQRQERKPKPPK
jgi:hypothetical protein